MLKHMLFGGGIGIKGDSWVATLGGSSYDYGRSVAVAPDGSVYVCGYTSSDSAGSSDLLLAKFSSSGTVQWQKILSGDGTDDGYSVAVAPDGSVYVCGRSYSYSDSAGGWSFLIAKFSSSGTVQWQRKLGGDSVDEGRSVAVAPDGSVYVCGYTKSVSAGHEDLLLAKFSSSGTMQWQKILGGSSTYDEGHSVAVAPDGSVYVCGQTWSSTQSQDELFLAKFSSSGTVQWQKTLGEDRNDDHGHSVAVAPDGSVYVCGPTFSTGGRSWGFLIAKFSSSGTVQWQKTLDGSSADEGRSVAVAPDGSVYVCGYTSSVSAGSSDLLLAKFSSSGTVQWQKILGGSKLEYGYSVAVAPDGSVYVCGETYSAGAGPSDLLLVKITDSLIEKDIVTFDNLTFQDASLTAKNVSFTSTSSSLSVSNAGLTVRTPSLTVGTPSFTTNLYIL